MGNRPPLKFLSATLNTLFPGRCLHCGLASGRDLDLCPGCEAELPRLDQQCEICAEPLATTAICGQCLTSPPEFSRVIAPFLFQPPVSLWVGALKHRGDLRAGRVLGQLLVQHLAELEDELSTVDCLVPVPLHWRRRLTRGFNQSRELARALTLAASVPVNDRLVRRARHTPHQQQLARQARTANLRSAFEVRGHCAGLRLAVIDDVVTTTSTARALAATLMAAGAHSVRIWAVARTALEI